MRRRSLPLNVATPSQLQFARSLIPYAAAVAGSMAGVRKRFRSGSLRQAISYANRSFPSGMSKSSRSSFKTFRSTASSPSYLSIRTKQKKKRRNIRQIRAARRKRNFKKKIKKIAREQPLMGRPLLASYKAGGTIECNKNECAYLYTIKDATTATYPLRVATKADLQGLSNNEFKILGQTDALATRVETYDLNTSLSNSLLYYKINATLDLVNNYQYPAQVSVYWCKNKEQGTAANHNTVHTVTEGLTDLAVSSPATNLHYYARHSPVFRKNWTVVKQWNVVLKPGEHIICSGSTGKKTVSLRWLNDNANEYLTGKTHEFLVRIQGAIAHGELADAPTDDVGYASAKVDAIFTRKSWTRFQGMHQIQEFGSANALGDAVRMVVDEDPGLESKEGG